MAYKRQARASSKSRGARHRSTNKGWLVGGWVASLSAGVRRECQCWSRQCGSEGIRGQPNTPEPRGWIVRWPTLAFASSTKHIVIIFLGLDKNYFTPLSLSLLTAISGCGGLEKCLNSWIAFHFILPISFSLWSSDLW